MARAKLMGSISQPLIAFMGISRLMALFLFSIPMKIMA
jgi:hypothetical protein